MRQRAPRSDGEQIRETFEEFVLGDGTRVGEIADPYNSHAWLQSNVTVVPQP